MNEFHRLPRPSSEDNERSRRGLPIALTLIILVVGAMGIIKFQGSKQQGKKAAPAVNFVPGVWDGELELWIEPLDRPDARILINYSFEYAAVPSYGGNGTISKRLKVFDKDAQLFLGPMKHEDLTVPGIKTMIQPALFEVLERSLFPRARGRLTEFVIHKVEGS